MILLAVDGPALLIAHGGRPPHTFTSPGMHWSVSIDLPWRTPPHPSVRGGKVTASRKPSRPPGFGSPSRGFPGAANPTESPPLVPTPGREATRIAEFMAPAPSAAWHPVNAQETWWKEREWGKRKWTPSRAAPFEAQDPFSPRPACPHAPAHGGSATQRHPHRPQEKPRVSVLCVQHRAAGHGTACCPAAAPRPRRTRPANNLRRVRLLEAPTPCGCLHVRARASGRGAGRARVPAASQCWERPPRAGARWSVAAPCPPVLRALFAVHWAVEGTPAGGDITN